MKSRVQTSHIVIGLLILVALVAAYYSQKQQQIELPWPRARFADNKPLGGKGYRLLLEWLGFTVRRVERRLNKMPDDAQVWLLFDYQTTFSRAELNMLLQWVKDGGTLVWAVSPFYQNSPSFGPPGFGSSGNKLNPGRELYEKFHIKSNPPAFSTDSLPPLSPLSPSAPAIYWNDAKGASASSGTVEIERAHLEIAGDVRGAQVALMPYGKGRIMMVADATLFTNYALAKPDTAVFATNLIRAHALPKSGAIYFDEREHNDDTPVGAKEVEKTLPYYLWRPPLRYALLQLGFAALLMWGLFGRRLGAPVPLPVREHVTRASQFAGAMGMLLHKTGRPHAAARILGDEFRRNLAHRLGMSPHDSDEMLAQRAAMLSGMPAEHIERLLFQARTPIEDEVGLLDLTQQTEYVLRRLSR